MQSKFKRILFGGDYNPNQWPKEVWKQDMAYFKDAHINSATINVFSWAKIQPSENEYNFTELDEIVDMLSNENYDIVMATSTAALPAWMVKKYPETMSTDYEGRQHKFGARHNFCPNSLVEMSSINCKFFLKIFSAYFITNMHFHIHHICFFPTTPNPPVTAGFF